MKKRVSFLVMVMASLVMLNGCSDSKERKQKLEAKKQLGKEVEQAFQDYGKAREQWILFTCTQKLAEFQQVKLLPVFYEQQQQAVKTKNTTQATLNAALERAKALFGGEMIKNADEVIQANKDLNVFDNPHEITRGYCYRYQATMGTCIAENLDHYRITPAETASFQKTAAIYLDTQGHIANITADIKQQEVPSSLMINNKSYEMVCHYRDAAKYEQAMAAKGVIPHKPLNRNDRVYQASQYFYQHVSPQIDHIVVCHVPHLPITTLQRVSDTYPWYQPIATGSQNEKAAGDVLTAIKNNELILILGHEPCACNSNDETHCNKLKAISRDYKSRFWSLLTSMENEKPRHNAQAQQAIDEWIAYGKEEIRKDYCFIDQLAMLKHLDALFEKMIQVEVKGKPPVEMDKKEKQGRQLIDAVFAVSDVQKAIQDYQHCKGEECRYSLKEIATQFAALKDYPDFDNATYQNINTILASLNQMEFSDQTYALAIEVITKAKKVIREKAPTVDLPLDDGLLPSMNILPLKSA